MKDSSELTDFKMGCRILAMVLFIGAAMSIRGYFVRRYFERGAIETHAIVTEVKTEHRHSSSGRVRSGGAFHRGSASTTTSVDYVYEVNGKVYEGRELFGNDVSVRMYFGDTIRIEYAAEKPSLSRLKHE